MEQLASLSWAGGRVKNKRASYKTKFKQKRG